MKAPASMRSMRPRRRSVLGVAALGLAVTATGALPAGAAGASSPTSDDRDLVNVVSSRYPANDPTRELSALRPAGVVAGARAAAPALVEADPHPWQTVTTLTGVVKDVDFVNRKVGYAAAELGVIWKTVDGGKTWQQVVNVGYPFYFYGVAALSADEVVVSGFDNAAGFEEAAIVWRTLDGGATWSTDIGMDPYWASRVRFADDEHGLIAGIIGSTVWHTETGGETEEEWTYEQPAADDGWFGSQFTLLPSLRAYASGISFCQSPDGGTTWGCESSVDEVFDGPTSFVTKNVGWVGGGTISPTVEGWLHRTTDGGDTWSGRVLQTDYPIRQVESLNQQDVYAAGGDGFSGVGGIMYSSDGGVTWSADLATDTEVGACDHRRVQRGSADRIWCIGYNSAGGWHSDVYRVTVPRD